MKVLHIIDSLGSGGAERSLYEMLGGFVARGIDSEVVVFYDHPHGFTSAVRTMGIPVHFVRARTRTGRVIGLRRIVAEVRPDLVHTSLFEADVLGRLGTRGTGIPIVTSLVNTAYGAPRSDASLFARRKLDLVRVLDGITARRCGGGFHAITAAVRDDAVAHLGLDPSDITVIPRGRDTARLGERSDDRRRRVRSRLGVTDADFLVVNVGRQEYQKGQAALLRAAARLRDAGEPVRVVVAGRCGGKTRHLETLLDELDLRSTVRFLGLVDDVPDLLVAADVLAFPSRFEGLGGTVIEALALQTPVVASDVPALREVLDGGRLGLLVPPDDPDALAGAIDAVRRDPAAAEERARLGRARFLENYALDQVTAAMVGWFEAMRDRDANRVAAGG